jgi:hypothetical protein
MNERVREGHCLCGAVRFRTVGEPTWSGWCHCTMCQRAAGAPAVAWSTFPVERVTWSGEPRAIYRSSDKAERGFCARCGGALTFLYFQKAHQIDMATAAFDDPGSLPPQEHVWADTRVPWMDAGSGLPVRPPKPPGQG